MRPALITCSCVIVSNAVGTAHSGGGWVQSPFGQLFFFFFFFFSQKSGAAAAVPAAAVPAAPPPTARTVGAGTYSGRDIPVLDTSLPTLLCRIMWHARMLSAKLWALFSARSA